MNGFRTAWGATSPSDKAYGTAAVALIATICLVIVSAFLSGFESPSAQKCQINAYINCAHYSTISIVGAIILVVATMTLVTGIFFAILHLVLRRRKHPK
jgi:uncharacterized BrkB/YihY/UPF0761 family membrane protein